MGAFEYPVSRPSDRLAKYGDRRANPAGKPHDDVWIIPRLAKTHAERIKTPGGDSAFPTHLPLELLRRVVACVVRQVPGTSSSTRSPARPRPEWPASG